MAVRTSDCPMRRRWLFDACGPTGRILVRRIHYCGRIQPRGRMVPHPTPLAFAAAGVPYLLLFAGAVIWLPRRLAGIVAVVIALSHAFAAAMWCRILFDQQMLALATVAVSVVCLGALAWQRGWNCSAETSGAITQPNE